MLAEKIPRFFLYGEPPRAVDGRFLHLEALDDRSRPANWNIRPHTHANLNHLLHITVGGGVMHADARILAFDAPCLLAVPAGVVHGFAFKADTQGSVLTVADGYLQDLVRREGDLAEVFRRPACLADHAEAELQQRFVRLARELAWTAPGHAAAVEALLVGVLVQALRFERYAAEAAPTRRKGPQAALVARFRELLEKGYRSETSVEAYAEALKVPSKRLRSACLAVAGVTPGRIIQDRLLLEAKRLLLYSDMGVAETAYYLGFSDPAYFTRVFTRACKLSPRRYRQLGGGAPAAT